MLAVVLACFAAGVGLRHTVPRAVELLPQLDRFVLWVALPALILAKLLADNKNGNAATA